MKWLDYVLAGAFPKYAIRRVQARQGIKAFYEAARSSQYHKARTSSGSADDENLNAVDKLRIQARHAEENYDIASGVLDVLVNNVVGLGIRPMPQVMGTDGKLHREVNDQLLKLYKDWIKRPEVTHEHSYYGLQRLMARTWFRDGEVLSQYIEGNTRSLDHGTRVPLSLEVMEADYLPMDLDDANKGIIQGVTKNQWGRPRFYHIYKHFPTGLTYAANADMKRVPADRIQHLKFVKRLGQTRGVSVFAAVLNRFDDIKEIEESERVAARVAAAMTGFIRKGGPDQYIAPETAGEARQMEFDPGMVYDNLAPGEEVGTISSNRPNNGLIPFRDANLKAAAAGTGSSYSSISNNYDGTYSSQRQELAESYVNYGALWGTFCERSCTPTWERLVRAAIAAKLITIPKDVDRDTLFDVEHSRPPMISVDPAKEMSAIREELDLQLSAKSQVQRRRGNDPDEVRAQIARDMELDEEAGIIKQPVVPEDEGDTPPDDEEDDDSDDESDDQDETK